MERGEFHPTQRLDDRRRGELSPRRAQAGIRRKMIQGRKRVISKPRSRGRSDGGHGGSRGCSVLSRRCLPRSASTRSSHPSRHSTAQLAQHGAGRPPMCPEQAMPPNTAQAMTCLRVGRRPTRVYSCRAHVVSNPWTPPQLLRPIVGQAVHVPSRPCREYALLLGGMDMTGADVIGL